MFQINISYENIMNCYGVRKIESLFFLTEEHFLILSNSKSPAVGCDPILTIVLKDEGDTRLSENNLVPGLAWYIGFSLSMSLGRWTVVWSFCY